MQQRLPILLSATALVVALFGATPLGNAARDLVRAIPPFAKKARFATNAGAVNGIHASKTAKPGYLLALGDNGKFPSSVGEAGPAGAQGPKGDPGANGATNVIVRTGTPITVPGLSNGNDGVADAFAQCKPGEHMTGGGGEGVEVTRFR